MSEMQADVTATIKALRATLDAANEALMWAKTVDIDLNRRVTPLPAPALTEQAIVDALKADPAMAGRVIAKLAYNLDGIARRSVQESVADFCQAPDGSAARALQSLAVALAAASYLE